MACINPLTQKNKSKKKRKVLFISPIPSALRHPDMKIRVKRSTELLASATIKISGLVVNIQKPANPIKYRPKMFCRVLSGGFAI